MTKKLRTDEIAKLLNKATQNASRSWSPEDGIAVKLYAIGEGGSESTTEITPEQRDELLARAVAKQHVQLDVEMLAYEQKPGERNRNAVRVRDESIIAMAATGKGKPCLKDHEHYDSLSVAGRILWSRGSKVGDGYEIRMRVRLSAPWAVELALRDLLGAVSISWEALGPIMCTACNAAIRTKCWHWPGMTVSEVPQGDGTKRFVWDPNGTVVVEWLYTKAGILEVSLVPIGAVQKAGIDGIRAVLSAAGFSTENEEDAIAAFMSLHADSTPPTDTQEGNPMSKLDAALAAYNEMSADDRKSFAAKLMAELEPTITALRAAALAADPVEVTLADGTEIRKSAGAQAIAMAKLALAAEKREAAAAKLASDTQAAADKAALAVRAKEVLAGMAGSDEVHLQILGAVEPLGEEAVRVLKAWRNGGVAKPAPGVNPELAPTKAETFEQTFSALSTALTAFCATNKIDDVWTTGLLAFKKTPEGKALADAYTAFTK